MRDWIVGLDDRPTVDLMRELLIAEAGRRGAELETVQMTGAIHVGDGGVDGHTDLPESPGSPFPSGPWCWQVKSGAVTPSISAVLNKHGVLQDLEAGRDFILVWSRDPAGGSVELRKRLKEGVTKLASQREGRLYTAEDIERLARCHPAVVQRMGGPQVLGLTWDQWRAQFALDFVPDDPRLLQMAAIKAFATSTGASSHLRIFGDSGAGKSRLALEALGSPELRGRVVVAQTFHAVEYPALHELISTDDASVILVVDDCTEAEAEELERLTSSANGRIRLITIGEWRFRNARPGLGDLDVRPLDGSVFPELLRGFPGIDEDASRRIADATQGYPRLAVEVARAVADEGLINLAGLLSQQRVSALLERMVPVEADRKLLARLALFDRVGHDDELAHEAKEVCEVFELDHRSYRRVVEQENGRFVSRAGRYRQVTPRALAAWLFRQAMIEEGDAAVERLAALSPGLFDSFRAQVELIGAEPTVQPILKELLVMRTESFRGAADIDPATARLMHASAFSIPEESASLIAGLVQANTAEELSTDLTGESRRSLVLALEYLLWFKATFDLAADSLLALARAENESWANNATGTLVSAFQVNLGGTEVAFRNRLEWLIQSIRLEVPRDAEIALSCMAAALDYHDRRSSGGGTFRSEPTEWRPSSVVEDTAARLGAWDAVIKISRLTSTQTHAAQTLAAALRPLLGMGHGDYILTSLRQPWNVESRSLLFVALSRAIRYDAESLDTETSDALHALRIEIAGPGLADQGALLLATEYWELAHEADDLRDTPEPIRRFAHDLLTADDPLALITGLLVSDPPSVKGSTAFHVCRLLGELDVDGRLEAIADDPLVTVDGRIGYFRGRSDAGDVEFVNARLAEWPEDPTMRPHIAAAVSVAPPSDERLMIAIESSDDFRTFGVFATGRWVQSVGPVAFGKLISRFQAEPLMPRDHETLLMIIDTWLGANELADEDLHEKLVQALERAYGAEVDGLSSLVYQRNKIADRLELAPEVRLELTLNALRTGFVFDSTHRDIQSLVHITCEDPERFVPRIVDFLLEPLSSFRLSHVNVLSLISTGCQATSVLFKELSRRSGTDRRKLLSQISFEGTEPDALFVALLEAHQDDPDFARAAAGEFPYPRGGWTGEMSQMLEGRARTLEKWLAETSSEALGAWAPDLITDLRTWATRAADREAEDPWR